MLVVFRLGLRLDRWLLGDINYLSGTVRWYILSKFSFIYAEVRGEDRGEE